MTTIKLEIPSSDEIAMFHMGEALRNMAVDYGYVVPSKCNITHTETVGDVRHSVKVESYVPVNSNVTLSTADGNFILSSSDEPESNGDDMTKDIAAEHDRLLGESDTIDADGLPWDQRIHSKGKTRIGGNVWRSKKKPNEKTDEEWAEYVEGIKVELKALMAIPVATGAELDVLANIPVITAEQRVELKLTPPVVDVNGVEFRQSPGVVHEVEINCTIDLPPVVDSATFEAVANGDIGAGQPVRIVTPPVDSAVIAPPVDSAVIAPPVDSAVIAPPVDSAVIAPPVVDAVVTPPPADFGALMRFITANKAKLTSPVVDEALKAQGLASIALLAARTDLIPQIHAALVKLL